MTTVDKIIIQRLLKLRQRKKNKNVFYTKKKRLERRARNKAIKKLIEQAEAAKRERQYLHALEHCNHKTFVAQLEQQVKPYNELMSQVYDYYSKQWLTKQAEAEKKEISEQKAAEVKKAIRDTKEAAKKKAADDKKSDTDKTKT